jgi:3-oxoacyl-[acyl-carrier protein] reductase
MSHPLKGKRALVTGGSRGIGAAIVKRLAREGADVALTYVSKPDEAGKTALVGLVQGLSRDLGPRGITINNV